MTDLSRLDKLVENLEDAAYLFGSGGPSQPLTDARQALLAAIEKQLEEAQQIISSILDHPNRYCFDKILIERMCNALGKSTSEYLSNEELFNDMS